MRSNGGGYGGVSLVFYNGEFPVMVRFLSWWVRYSSWCGLCYPIESSTCPGFQAPAAHKIPQPFSFHF